MENKNSAWPRYRYRALALAGALLVLTTLVAATNPNPQAGNSRRLRRRSLAAAACLLSRRRVHDVIRDLGLRLGEPARIAYFQGDAPRFERTTQGDVWIMFFPVDGRRAWILSAVPGASGRYNPDATAYQLQRRQNGWTMVEGDGGLATYAAMTRFANWLDRHGPKITLRLEPQSDFCDLRPGPRISNRAHQ